MWSLRLPHFQAQGVRVFGARVLSLRMYDFATHLCLHSFAGAVLRSGSPEAKVADHEFCWGFLIATKETTAANMLSLPHPKAKTLTPV